VSPSVGIPQRSYSFTPIATDCSSIIQGEGFTSSLLLDVGGVLSLVAGQRSVVWSEVSALGILAFEALCRLHELARVHEADQLRQARAKILRVQAHPKTSP
jgi:hypothetical protein